MLEYRATIVIPLLVQRDDWLRQCVVSALQQTVPSEVIVVVSPRTKRSNLNILEQLGKLHRNLRVVAERPDRGFAGAINAGLWSALTERVGLLLSDDWLEPSAVEESMKFSTDIVSTGTIAYASDGRSIIDDRPLTQAQYNQRLSLEEKASYLSHFFLFQRKKVLEIGGVDESIGNTGADDYDLIWTLLEHGATVSVVGRSLYNYRDHGEERLSLRNREEQVRNLEKILDKHSVSAHDRNAIVAKHSRWYGKPIQVVLEDLKNI
jgi:GT2 family glycosyltransferase